MLSEDKTSISPEALTKESKMKMIMDWCWKLAKRRLSPGDLLFEEGDIYCQISSKYVPLDVKQQVSVRR